MKKPGLSVLGAFLFPLVMAAREDKPGLLPPHDELPPTYWEQHGWLVVVAGILTVIVVAGLIALLCRRKPPVVTPPEVLARRQLEALRGLAEDGPLLVKVSGILRRFVLHVCSLPPDELTTAELRQAIQASPQLGPELSAEINGFLRQCDERKFAPAPPVPPTDTVTTALALMDKVELNRKSTVDAATPPAPIAAP